MISTISTIILLSVLPTPTSSTTTSTSISLLKTLLKPTLMKATCTARCSGVSSEEMEDCLELCLAVLEDPSSPSLCDFPQLCTGGCRAACESSRAEERREVSVSQQDCLLSWHLDQSHSAPLPLVFVVTGLDQAGMINIISPLHLDSSLYLSPATTSKYREITVLAVDTEGLLDMKTVIIQEVEICPLNTQEELSPSADFINTNLVHICLVVIILIIVLTFLIIKLVRTIRRRQARQSSVKKESLEDVYYSDNVFLICQDALAEDVKYLNLV